LGLDWEEAIREAKKYITSAIQQGKEAFTGKGFGPVNHFFDPKQMHGIIKLEE
jgi:hydroxymethylpyrimidine/phosphomethylpyrimidine kinase